MVSAWSARYCPGGMAIRDTNDRDGVVLTITAKAWRQFADALK